MTFRQTLQETTNAFALGYQLAKAHFKVRNEGSYLGVFWYLLEPLAFFIVLLFLGGVIYNNSIPQYPAYLLLGLIMFNFFLAVTGNASGIIIKNKYFVKSIKVDSAAFIFAGVLQSIFSHIFEVALFIFLLIYLKTSVWLIIFYPVIFICLCLFTTGVAFIFAAVGVFVIDWGNVWNVAGRLIWFVTPVFYVLRDSNSLIAKFNYFNPLSHFITVARNIIVYGEVPTIFSVLGIIVISFGTFLVGYFIFNKGKIYFAERV
ncbi:MAG: ABC transporter permease [bacterium]